MADPVPPSKGQGFPWQGPEKQRGLPSYIASGIAAALYRRWDEAAYARTAAVTLLHRRPDTRVDAGPN